LQGQFDVWKNREIPGSGEKGRMDERYRETPGLLRIEEILHKVSS